MKPKILTYEEFKDKLENSLKNEDYLTIHKLCESYTEYACIYYRGEK